MGPRSDNRGYVPVVIRALVLEDGPVIASMGPRSDNRGYEGSYRERLVLIVQPASMGPRSDNRGYVDHAAEPAYYGP